MESWQIAGKALEYFDDTHEYLVDGILVPSVTTLLKIRFGKKYQAVSGAVLKRAAAAGTEVHEAVEAYCIAKRAGEPFEGDLPELRGFKFLQKAYGFTVKENEVPVILHGDYGYPVAAGRLDLVLEKDGVLGLGDIKRTATLDKEYLACQLNLYRIAYQQCYGKNIEFLRGLHLRENKRKYAEIPINEDLAWSLVAEYEEWES